MYGKRGQLPIGLSHGVITEQIIPRPAPQNDRFDIAVTGRKRRLEVVVRNGVIARTAIKGD